MSDMASAASFKTKQRPWWLLLIEGILVTIVGAILLFADKSGKIETYLILVVSLGFYWLFRGIMDLVSMFVDHTAWGWKLFMGIVGILAGGYILVHPVLSAAVLPQIFVLVLGIWGLLQGIILLIMAFQGGGWGAGILGALAIIFGLILIADYGELFTGLAMLWSAAILALIGGIVMIVRAIMQATRKQAA
jgi:uncharacterized membrane protein HdeD (DUF308 family)